ncbi:MAG: nucleoside phosphorylase [Planctomycetota bacterium]|nr:MAG: nucleoside phosphorylase [Planctomycetota bacterium]
MVFRSLVQGLIREQVAQTVQDHVRQKVEETVSKAQPQEPPDRQPPCDVGFIFAMGIEAGGLEDLLSDVVYLQGEHVAARYGNLDGRRVVIVISGPGRKAAAHATEALLLGHRPRWIVSAGFAGGLVPELRYKDIVMVDRVCDTTGKSLKLDLEVDREAVAQTPGLHVAPLVTTDHIVRRQQERQELHERYRAWAVDMETFAVAQVCRAHQMPLLAVRVISDEFDFRLPPEVDAMLDRNKWTEKAGTFVAALWRRPSSIKDFWALKERALVASDHLAKFLQSMTAQLPRSNVAESDPEAE